MLTPTPTLIRWTRDRVAELTARIFSLVVEIDDEDAHPIWRLACARDLVRAREQLAAESIVLRALEQQRAEAIQ